MQITTAGTLGPWVGTSVDPQIIRSRRIIRSSRSSWLSWNEPSIATSDTGSYRAKLISTAAAS